MLALNRVQILFGLVVALCGCTRYEAMPLSPSAVRRSLAAPSNDQLRVEARSIRHPLLKPISFDDRSGLTPDQAAIIAVLMNPSLRAARDERGLASAQLLQAGILPNPQLNFGEDYPYGGDRVGAVTASAVGLSWDASQLIWRDALLRAARAKAASVDLDIAWREWQTAQAARTAVYDLISLQAQCDLANRLDRQSRGTLEVVRKSVDRQDGTLLDLSAAESASFDAHSTALSLERDLDDARLTLNKTLGLSSDATVTLNPRVDLPDHISAPSPVEITAGLEKRRLDLIALRLGYQSQEETLRAAVLEQFPKINIGFNRQRDDTNVQSLGFAVTIDLPIFDRNQGAIAGGRATRQELFDEYVQRLFDARCDVYLASADLKAISREISADKESFPPLQRTADTYRDALGNGNIDVLTYYAAMNALGERQLEDLKLKQQLIDNAVALELAAGEYFPLQTQK